MRTSALTSGMEVETPTGTGSHSSGFIRNRLNARVGQKTTQWPQLIHCCSPTVEALGRPFPPISMARSGHSETQMPGAKRLHQESDSSGEAPYIYGHHHGAIGILAGWVKKLFCIPLCAEPHEGVDDLRRLQGKAEPEIKGRYKISVTTLMAAMAAEVVSVMGRSAIIVLEK